VGFASIELIPGPSMIRPSISVVVGQLASFMVAVKNEQDCPVDLTKYIPPYDNPPVNQCQNRVVPVTTGVVFTMKSTNCQDPPEVQKLATIQDPPTNGQVLVEFHPCDITRPGLYLAELSLIFEGSLEFVYRLYVEAGTSLAWYEQGQPLTIEEIRLWARDNGPYDNFLLDEVEYKDTEIIAAIRRTIDLWNSTPPLMARFTFSPITFPVQYRSQWIDNTIGFLMDIAAQNYLRNHLTYQAGGVEIDDKRHKYQYYTQESQRRLQSFKEWMTQIKPQLNATQAWSRLGYYRLPGHGGGYGY
jgi:hypothetical protein